MYQVVAGGDGDQIHTLQLSGVGEERVRAGAQDVVTHSHELTTLRGITHTYLNAQEVIDANKVDSTLAN